MASQFVSAAAAEARVRFRSDTVGLTTRHTSVDMQLELNYAFRRLRELVSSCGLGVFLTPTAVLPLSTTPPTTGQRYVEIDWPVNMTAIWAVTVLQSSEWYKLKPADFSQLWGLNASQFRGYGCDPELPPAAPFWWTPQKVPTAVTTTQTPGKILIFPLPQASQSYQLWGNEIWDDITGTSVFPGHSIWHDWMIEDCAITIVTRDNNAQGTLDGLIAQRAYLEGLIRKEIRLLLNDGPVEPSDRESSYPAYGPRMIP